MIVARFQKRDLDVDGEQGTRVLMVIERGNGREVIFDELIPFQRSLSAVMYAVADQLSQIEMRDRRAKAAGLVVGPTGQREAEATTLVG